MERAEKNLFIKGLKNIRTDKRLIIYLMARWASAQIQEHKNEPHIFSALRQTHKKKTNITYMYNI